MFFLAAAAATKFVGSAISAYGSHSSGRAQEAIAQLNAAQKEKNARMEYMSLVASSNMHKQSAIANFKLRSLEAQARDNNAISLENQALGGDASTRANLERFRENSNRAIAQQRGQIAASGMVEGVGTPLDTLAESAGNSMRQQQDILYANELARTQTLAQAGMERFSGRVGLAQAALDKKGALQEAKLRKLQAGAGYASSLRSAALMRMSGKAEARAGAIQAGSTLLSSAGNAYYDYKQLG